MGNLNQNQCLFIPKDTYGYLFSRVSKELFEFYFFSPQHTLLQGKGIRGTNCAQDGRVLVLY